MIAWTSRFALLLAAAASVAAVHWLPPSWAPYGVLVLPAALWVALATTLACEFALVKIMAMRPHPQLPTARMLLGAWWGELWVSCRLVLWRIPVLSGQYRDTAAAVSDGSRGLVLVHGYGCNRGVWADWLKRLQLMRIPCIALNLEPLFASIDDYGPLIEGAVADLKRKTGLAPVLVGHSMGGVVARAWWVKDNTASKLHRLITIGSPHQGTLLARLGWGKNAAQMRSKSAWLAGLSVQETPAHKRRTLCFYGDCDNVVIPSANATLPGSARQQLPGAGHLAMLDHPVLFAAVLHSLREST